MELTQQAKQGNQIETMIKVVSLYQQDRGFSEEVDEIERMEGEKGLERFLNTNMQKGISNDPDDLQERERMFGSNKKQEVKSLSFIQLLLMALNDFTLKILMVAAVVSIAISTATAEESHRSTAWIEGFSMIIAVIIVSGVTALNDLQKQKQFADLNNVADSKKVLNVIRDGKTLEMHQSEVLVGDLVVLREGMQLPADGLLVKESEVVCDESAMTGETDPLKKDTMAGCIAKRDQIIAEGGKNSASHHDVPSPIVMSGTKVLQGEGLFVVLLVGENTCEGKIGAMLRQNEVEVTPLQQKLETIANDIGKFGLISSILIFFILILRFAIERIIDKSFTYSHITDILGFFILGVAVIVMAIPEGLPLSVTISLAFSVKRMLKDMNLVRKLQACETMGGANMICSDKTGTLTQNKMTLTKIWNGKVIDLDDYSATLNLDDYIPKEMQELFLQSTVINSSAILRPQVQGSKTEVSILEFLERCNIDYEKLRQESNEIKKMPFNSSRKRMGIILGLENGSNRLVEKGASEMILEACSHFHSFTHGVQPIEAYREQVDEAIVGLANQALRTIGLAYLDMGTNVNTGQQDNKGVYEVEKQGLTLIGILGIKDILRKEVPQAVLDCRTAGIKVRMVTGDNKLTAQAIAKECNIIQPGDTQSIVMEGVEFISKVGGVICINCKTQLCDCPRDEETAKKHKRKQRKDTVANAEEFDKIYPHLDVLARSRPEDKYALVTGLIERGHVVAVTGDGTNDAPALKKADVGFAMGIAGTEVAKQAASIILLDDNFSSIVKAVLWGRNIYDSIRKFLQFQLTVNLVGVGITLVGACTIKSEILTPIQMLWINLIMDALASLALATESPDASLLQRHPHKRDDYIVNKKMFKHIVGQAIYQMIILCIIAFCEFIIPEVSDDFDGIIKNKYDYCSQQVTSGQALDYDCKIWYNMGYKIKYGDATVTTKGTYARSGREKTISDTQNLYPFLTQTKNGKVEPLKKGYDYKAIYPTVVEVGPSRHFTFVFNTFLWMTIFNFINARKLLDEKNVFKGILSNNLFLIIVFIIVTSQIVLVSFGGIVFTCYTHGPYYGLNWTQWLICIAFGAGGLIVNFLLKLINEDKLFKGQAGMGNKETNPLDHSGVLAIKRSQQFSNRMNVGNLGSNQFRQGSNQVHRA